MQRSHTEDQRPLETHELQVTTHVMTQGKQTSQAHIHVENAIIVPSF